MLKANMEKGQISYKGKLIRMTADFSTGEAEVFQDPREDNSQSRLV